LANWHSGLKYRQCGQFASTYIERGREGEGMRERGRDIERVQPGRGQRASAEPSDIERGG